MTPRRPAHRARGARPGPQPDRAVRDPQRARSGPPGRPHRRDVAATGASHGQLRRRHRAAAAHRVPGRRRAGGEDHRRTARGGAGPCSSLIGRHGRRSVVVLDDREAAPAAPPQRDWGELARRAWVATWPKLAAVALALGVWQVVVWSGWKPEYVLPAPATVFDRLGELIADGTVSDAIGVTMRRAAIGFALAVVIGVLIGGVVASSTHRPVGGRVDDHRPADDAVDRLVPARDRAVPALRGGDHVRRRARRGAVDRQRADRRRRPRPADPAARRSGDGRHAASPASATSCCRRRCRRSSAGSSRGGRSPGAA